MSVSPVKNEILETMLLNERSLKATQIAKEVGKEFPSVMMHIIGLTRMGYASSPEKGFYTITDKGKNALGVPEVNRENAKAILACMPPEKAFHFYASLGKPLNLRAQSLQDFCDKILNVSTNSIEFHTNRGDFEAWFAGLGDLELKKKTALLKEKKVVGEKLRRRLQEIVEKRYTVLARIAGLAIPL
jgi:predicted transcriptional regulator